MFMPLVKPDVLTIEIEQVNIDALEKLESEGVKVVPSSAALRIIKNKISQKNFYQANQIPTSAYVVTQNLEEVRQHKTCCPPFINWQQAGMTDGRADHKPGRRDRPLGFRRPRRTGAKIGISQEISIIIAVDQQQAIPPSIPG